MGEQNQSTQGRRHTHRVINLALLRVLQHIVRLVDLLELLGVTALRRVVIVSRGGELLSAERESLPPNTDM